MTLARQVDEVTRIAVHPRRKISYKNVAIDVKSDEKRKFVVETSELRMRWLYLITCSFTLAKTLRHRHKADWSQARLAERQSRNAAAAVE